MKNHMRDFATIKEKINLPYEYEMQMRLNVVRDLESKISELEQPLKTLSRIKDEAEKIRQRLF